MSHTAPACRRRRRDGVGDVGRGPTLRRPATPTAAGGSAAPPTPTPIRRRRPSSAARWPTTTHSAPPRWCAGSRASARRAARRPALRGLAPQPAHHPEPGRPAPRRGGRPAVPPDSIADGAGPAGRGGGPPRRARACSPRRSARRPPCAGAPALVGDATPATLAGALDARGRAPALLAWASTTGSSSGLGAATDGRRRLAGPPAG